MGTPSSVGAWFETIEKKSIYQTRDGLHEINLVESIITPFQSVPGFLCTAKSKSTPKRSYSITAFYTKLPL